jgi:hypothetical protein
MHQIMIIIIKSTKNPEKMEHRNIASNGNGFQDCNKEKESLKFSSSIDGFAKQTETCEFYHTIIF